MNVDKIMEMIEEYCEVCGSLSFMFSNEEYCPNMLNPDYGKKEEKERDDLKINIRAAIENLIKEKPDEQR